MLNKKELINKLNEFFNEGQFELGVFFNERSLVHDVYCRLKNKRIDTLVHSCFISVHKWPGSYALTFNSKTVEELQDKNEIGRYSLMPSIKCDTVEELARIIYDYFTGKRGIPVAYLANIYKGEKNYSGHFIDFDGCAFADKDFYKCIKRAQGALALHLEGMLEDGEPLPPVAHDWRINGRDMDEENYLVLIETELKIGG